jgi:hypothetical protein
VPKSLGDRVEYRRQRFNEWYANNTRGLEQGFTFLDPPQGHAAAPLVVELEMTGSLTPVLSGDIITIKRRGQPIFRYSGLSAWDANGRTRPAHMEVRGNRMQLFAEAQDAVYPVVIDPWVQQQMLSAPGESLGAVAAVGDTAIIGSIGRSAIVFTRSGSTWTQTQTLTPYCPDDPSTRGQMAVFIVRGLCSRFVDAVARRK